MLWDVVERETRATLKKTRVMSVFYYLNKETPENLAGNSEVVWRSWLKSMAMSLNKFNL